jgi:putative radical SAM enzyme (TIGR03279 family)
VSAKIQSVSPGSPAAKAGISPGDILRKINGHTIIDVLDYKYYAYDAELFLELTRDNGTRRFARIRRPDGEDIGLEFETYLMDGERSCANNCIFCFIDQLPRGMRKTLYYKDDDARLSFLQGNYITLTNLSEREIQRMIDLRVSPLNVSVHSMNPELRSFMLGNPRGGETIATLRRFADAGITMNCQIVCCPGINDGEELEYSMRELAKLHPAVNSVSIVPVGLTRHRDGLYPIEPYDKARSADVINSVEAYAERCLEEHGSRIFYCADEFYIKADRDFPDDEYYEGYPQLENGVGMLRLLITDFLYELETTKTTPDGREFTVITGKSAAKYLRELIFTAKTKYDTIDHEMIVGTVVGVPNSFFGESVNVAGLITGGDILQTLRENPPRGRILLPRNMLRYGETTFLDGVTVREIEAFGEVRIVEQDGADFLRAIFGK